MSRNEWEAGVIKLPSAEFAKFRQGIQDADKAHKERVFNHTQALWKSLSRKEQTDPKALTNAAFNYAWGPRSNIEDQAVASDVQDRVTRCLNAGDRKPRRVQAADMDYPTNRTLDFDGSDGRVTFDRDQRTVTWEVSENNHACERARNSVVGKAFFDQMEKVRWTHGTGGVIIGNDEYSQDEGHYSSGAGGSYDKNGFGYLGAEHAPTCTRPFINGKGERVEIQTKLGRYGLVGKAVTAGSARGKTTARSNTGSFRSWGSSEQGNIRL